MSFEAIAVTAMLVAWLGAGFAAWLPWVAFNGPNRPLTRLGIALVAGLAGALLVPLLGARDERGFLLSPVAAFSAATVASFVLHRRLPKMRRIR